MGQEVIKNAAKVPLLIKRRKMLKILEEMYYDAGFERSSVWAFTKKGVEKYCSVTVPLYLGLGPSGGSYLRDVFYLNTFNVSEYINAINQNKMPVALSVDLTEDMQMAGWLYWRIYETRFLKSTFSGRFKKDFDIKYGKLMSFLSGIGFLKEDNQQVLLTDKGSYWIHAFEDWYSLDFISKLWGNSQNQPWPDKVELISMNEFQGKH
jgi:oxygen-independent coproporphyrinogen-3 oxidase